MLFCDCLDSLTVSFTSVPGSHECRDHLIMFCIIVPKRSSSFARKCNLQFLSGGAGQVLPPSLFMVPCRTAYEQPLQMITEPASSQGMPIAQVATAVKVEGTLAWRGASTNAIHS